MCKLDSLHLAARIAFDASESESESDICMCIYIYRYIYIYIYARCDTCL